MDQGDGQTGISVSGTGMVSIDAEIAHLQAGVVLSDRDLESVRAAAATKIAAARDHLLASGVEPADIKTARLNVHTSFDRDARRQIYHLSTGVEATIRNLGSAQAIVDELFSVIGEGIDMRGLTFAAKDPNAARSEAVELAFADALAKASQLAELAGVALGPVVSISEAESFNHRGPQMMRATMGAEASGIPIEPGQLDQQATINVRWAIEDR